MRKVKQGNLIELMDRKGISGDWNAGKRILSRGNSKCKGPAVRGHSAFSNGSEKRPVLLGQSEQGEKEGRNGAYGVRRIPLVL